MPMVKPDMIRLCYFASLSETLGVAAEDVELPKGVETVGELTDWLQQRGPAWATALTAGNIVTAVNHTVVHTDSRVGDGDEVAWFPPVTGG
jgi:molybdopterin synthase sulfur carrier subunit